MRSRTSAIRWRSRARSYGYDPRDRLATLTKTDTSNGQTLGAESYTHDANNNVTDQVVNGVATSFVYDRNRLLSSSSGGVTSGYTYDPYGRLDTVIANGVVLESYRYDGFDRTTRHTSTESGTPATTAYTYDPLDRTASRTEDLGGPGEQTTAFAYLGLSEQLITETDPATRQLQRSYQYSPAGQRLSQVTHDPATGTGEDSFYGYTPHTDVETLTTPAGDTRATYAYTAYGSDHTALFTGVDTPDPADPDAEPYNLYRYTAKRFDPSTGDYDMGFRDYNPQLNRFLARDTYNGALADLNLATSPWTGNRYAFTAGNPISLIETDGHKFEQYASGGGGGCAGCGWEQVVPYSGEGSGCAGCGTPLDAVGGALYGATELVDFACSLNPACRLGEAITPGDTVGERAWQEIDRRGNFNENTLAFGLGEYAGIPIPAAGAAKIASRFARHADDFLSLGRTAANTTITIRPPLSIGAKQFGAKWGKHASDYGLDPASSSARNWFRNRVRDVHLNPDEVRRGAWNPSGGGGENYFFFRQGENLVITQPGGEFVTMFPGASSNAWFKNAEVLPH